jgi:hypothetical protein
MRRLGILLLLMGVAACATATPPATRVANIATLAGTYRGTIAEDGMISRQARVVMQPDGSFEVSVSEPAGFRHNGRAIVDSADGSLIYQYDRGKGRAYVHEGDGRRVIVFNRADGKEVITVDTSLP